MIFYISVFFYQYVNSLTLDKQTITRAQVSLLSLNYRLICLINSKRLISQFMIQSKSEK